MPITNHYKTLKSPARSGIFYFKATAFAVLLFLCSAAIAQPRLSVTESTKKFGFVKKGTVVKNEYEITNTGNAPLLIFNAEVSCSCTSVESPDEPILPGKKGTVIISFDSKSAYGRQDRIVYLNSNDPDSPVKLRFKGTVSKE